MLGGLLYIIAGLIRRSIWSHRPQPEEGTNDSASATSATNDTEASNEKGSLSSSDNDVNKTTADEKLEISADDVKPEIQSGAKDRKSVV